MFCSPKKDIERYVSIKNHQIKTLKDQIESQKITQDSVESAKKRLDKLKAQYDQLLTENNFSGFALNIRKNQQKKAIIKEQIVYKQKQLHLKRSEQSDVITMRKQIAQKIKKTKQRIQSHKNKQLQIKKQRYELDNKINNLSKLTQKLRYETNDINGLQLSAKKQLIDCKGRLNIQSQKCKKLQQQMDQTGMKILSQKQKNNQISHHVSIQQNKIQNLQLKIQNSLYAKNILLQQKQKLQIQKLMVKQRAQLNRHQNVSDQMMKILVKISEAMKQSKQKQKQNCQRQIKQKLIQLELSQCINTQLLYSVSETKQKINMKQKKINKITTQIDQVLVKDLDIVSMVMGQQKVKNQQKTPFKIIDPNANKQTKQMSLKHQIIKVHEIQYNNTNSQHENQNIHLIQF